MIVNPHGGSRAADYHPDRYRERSPIEHSGNLDCPLLMVHGVNARRVPVSQPRLFRDRLGELGYEVDERDPGEIGADWSTSNSGRRAMSPSDTDQKIRLFRVLDGFLERRMGTVSTSADD